MRTTVVQDVAKVGPVLDNNNNINKGYEITTNDTEGFGTLFGYNKSSKYTNKQTKNKNMNMNKRAKNILRNGLKSTPQTSSFWEQLWEA